MTTGITADSAEAEGRRSRALALYEEVMCRPFSLNATPAVEAGLVDFAFGEVWSRPKCSGNSWWRSTQNGGCRPLR